jgi:Putative zinc dependent peptidase (DUF5700)
MGELSMKNWIVWIAPGAVLLRLLTVPAVASQQTDRVNLKSDLSEANAVLAILDKEAQHESVSEADWQKLFATIPYQRLKKREDSFRRSFGDEDFEEFVFTSSARRDQLRATLNAWSKADLLAAADRSLRYLPAEATIRASVYPVIKPQTNSFVFEATTNPAIFLYLDPTISQAQFENTVAHELHHIGLASLDAAYQERIKALPPNSRKVAEWMGALGEGWAMLAASGSPDTNPVADFPQSDQLRWNEDMKSFSRAQDELNQFFLDIIHNDFNNLEAADHQAFTFFGYRGPWYIVGYRMAVVIEKRFGRSALVETYRDPRQFVARYDDAASLSNANGGEKLPLFSKDILDAVGISKATGGRLPPHGPQPSGLFRKTNGQDHSRGGSESPERKGEEVMRQKG